VNRLVVARSAVHEDVADRANGRLDLDLQPGLLARLAQRGLLERLAGVRRSLRERPQRWLAAVRERDLDQPVDGSMHDAPG
jgi:hypothetical protein